MRRITGIILTISLLASCSNELEVHMDKPYEGPVIYFLLNPQDSVQYLRIQRVYLGESSALETGQNPDSIYPYGTIVRLEKLDGDEVIEEHIMEPLYDQPKDDGLFSSDGHLLYKYDKKVDVGYTYRLNIQLPDNDNLIQATTIPYSNLTVTDLNRWPNGINMVNKKFAKVSWLSLPNTETYQLLIRFHYYDLTKTDTIARYVDWKLPRVTSATLKGGETISINLNVENWYLLLGEKIPVDDNIVKRYAGRFDYRWDFAGEPLETYLTQDQTAQSGLLTDYPQYSNIQNAIGLFSYRSFYETNGHRISLFTLERLTTHPETEYLKFDGRQYW